MSLANVKQNTIASMLSDNEYLIVLEPSGTTFAE